MDHRVEPTMDGGSRRLDEKRWRQVKIAHRFAEKNLVKQEEKRYNIGYHG